MAHRDVTIINRLGLHARATAKLVRCAAAFSARVELERDGRRVDAKSIMAVMMLAAGPGTALRIFADGRDAEPALDALEQLIASRFGEAE